MRILFTIPAYTPAFSYGGPITAISSIAAGLAARGHDVSVITSDLFDRRGTRVRISCEVIDGVTIDRARTLCHRGWAPFSVDVARLLPRAIEGADVVHVCGFRDGITTAAALFARGAGAPIVFEPLGMYRAVGPSVHVKRVFDLGLGRSIARSASRVVASSRLELSELLAAGISVSRVALRPNPVEAPAEGSIDREGMRQKLGVSDGTFLLLFLGRIIRRKGPELIARALARVPPSRQIKLVVAGPDEGDGTLERVRAHLAARPGTLEVLGPTYGVDKWSLLAAADALALASAHGENFGMVAAEAMAVGTPVLLSSACGAREWVTSESGLVLDLDPSPWTQVFSALASRRITFDRARVPKAVAALRRDAVVRRQVAIYESALRDVSAREPREDLEQVG